MANLPKLPSELGLTPEDFQRVVVPEYTAAAFNIVRTSNEFAVILSKLTPAVTKDFSITGLQIENIALLRLSPQSAKDLWTLLGANLEIHEDQFGSLKTDYSQAKIHD